MLKKVLPIVLAAFSLVLANDKAGAAVSKQQIERAPQIKTVGPLKQADMQKRFADALRKDKRLADEVKKNPNATFFVANGRPKEGLSRIGRDFVIDRAGTRYQIGQVGSEGPGGYIACLLLGPGSIGCYIGLTIFFFFL